MSKIKFPPEFLLQIALLTNVTNKNTALGDDSPLAPWLIEQEIDLAADNTAAMAAQKQEETRSAQEAAGIQANSSRDTTFSPSFTFVRGGAQALKKFFINKYATLLDWGIPITESGRINYPASFEERNRIAAAFFKKLASYADGKSPLAAYIKNQNVNVADLSKRVSDSAKNNTDAIIAEKAAENAREQRDLLWKDVIKHLRAIGEYLKSIYPDNPRALGEWGYVVDDGVATKKQKKVKFIIGETKVIDSIRIGSIVINASKGDVLLYKGKGTSGAATLLKPNEKMGMVKGYSTITIVNPSTIDTACITIDAPED